MSCSLQSKEHTRQVRDEVVQKYKEGLVIKKKISQALNISHSTAQSIIWKWKFAQHTWKIELFGLNSKRNVWWKAKCIYSGNVWLISDTAKYKIKQEVRTKTGNTDVFEQWRVDDNEAVFAFFWNVSAVMWLVGLSDDTHSKRIMSHL